MPQTRNAEGTTDLRITNLVSSATQADGINLHGRVARAVVEHTYIQNTGDDVYALWGAALYVEESIVYIIFSVSQRNVCTH